MDTTLESIRQLVYREAGITLGPAKDDLVQTRLGKRLRALKLADTREYLAYLENDRGGDELIHLIDVISTNVTHFFREPDHFTLLAESLDRWARAGLNRLRIWSAACSSGEEPYTLAMVVHDFLSRNPRAFADVKILATDISTRVLGLARAGRYTATRLASVPEEFQRRCFRRVPGATDTYEVCEEVRRLVTFRRLNLSTPPFPMQGPFDAVLCRNVMIYFDDHVRGRLVREIHRLLRPDGLLMIGHSENLLGVALPTLRTERPSVYRKVDG